MAFTWTNNFGGGTNGAAVTVANSGGASGTAFSAVSGTTNYSNANVAGTARTPFAGQFTNTANALLYWYPVVPAGGRIWFRAYMRHPGYCTSPSALINTYPTSLPSDSATIFMETNGRLTIAETGLVTAGTMVNPVPLNAWFRLEGMFDYGSGDAELGLFGSPESVVPFETLVVSGADFQPATAINRFYFMCGTTKSAYQVDDLGISDVGPLGPTASTPFRGWGSPI